MVIRARDDERLEVDRDDELVDEHGSETGSGTDRSARARVGMRKAGNARFTKRRYVESALRFAVERKELTLTREAHRCKIRARRPQLPACR